MNHRLTFRIIFGFLLIVGTLQLAGAIEPGSATIIVAAKDSSSDIRSTADYSCDGSGDQSEINQALTRAAAGEDVVLSEGTFYCTDDIVVPSGKNLRGQGDGKTILDMRGSWVGVYPQGSNVLSDFTIVNMGGVFIQKASHIKLHRITVSSQQLGMHGAFSMYMSGGIPLDDLEFIECNAINVPGFGFWVGGDGGYQKQSNVRYINCKAIQCGWMGGQDTDKNRWATGFDLQEVNIAENILVKGCYAEGNWQAGFHQEPDAPTTNFVIEDCVAVNNGVKARYVRDPDTFDGANDDLVFGAGYFICTNAIVRNCTAEGNYRGVMLWWSQGCTIEDMVSRNTWGPYDYCITHASGLEKGNTLTDCTSENARGYAVGALGCYNTRFTNMRIVNPAGVDGYSIRYGLYYPDMGLSMPCENCVMDVRIEGGCNKILYSYQGTNTRLAGYASGSYTNPVHYISGNSRSVDTSGLVLGSAPVTTPTPTPTLTPKPTATPITPAPTPTQTPKPTATPTPVPTVTPGGSTGAPYVTHTLPGRVEAENYNVGGEGVAYHDTTSGNAGGGYRNDRVDIEKFAGENSYNVGWIAPGEWLAYTVTVPTADTYTAAFRVASPVSGGSFTLQVDGANAATISVPNTGGWERFQTVNQPVALPAGTHTIVLLFNGGSSGDYINMDYMEFALASAPQPTPTVTPTPAPTSQPTGEADLIVTDIRVSPTNPVAGEPVTFSATIQNQGGRATPGGVIHGVLFYVDNAPIVWSDDHTASIEPGASVTVTANGGPAGTSTWTPGRSSYTVTAYVDDINRMQERDENNNKYSKTLTVGATGGTLTPNPTLTPGSGGSAGTPYVTHALPGRIEAENYDLGGEGTGYHDTTSGNVGNEYRSDRVDIEKLAYESTPNVGWIAPGEWLAYTVTVSTADTYTAAFRVASPYSGGSFTLQVDGANAATVSVPNTGDWERFQTVTESVTLPAGTHTLRLSFNDDSARDYMNIDYVEFR